MIGRPFYVGTGTEHRLKIQSQRAKSAKQQPNIARHKMLNKLLKIIYLTRIKAYAQSIAIVRLENSSWQLVHPLCFILSRDWT